MTLKFSKILLTLFCLLFASALFAAVEIGQTAPDFTALTSTGKKISLNDYRGKIVVLEWTNKDCPYVKKHYSTGNMQALEKEYTGKGVVWLTILSSAPGKQGYLTAAQANQYIKSQNALPTAYVLDPQGTIGKLYDAKVTPHMYVINKAGILVYQGAIDSNPSADPNTITSATNYVKEALNDLLAGKPIKTTQTRAYGCSVKYAS